MAAFGCNFGGPVSLDELSRCLDDGLSIAAEAGGEITSVNLCDTMGWADPVLIRTTLNHLRRTYGSLRIGLHLHDTPGLGIANAFAAIELVVRQFDTAVEGLGGFPFAAALGARGNIATEELVQRCRMLGLETGMDLDRLIAAGHLAEEIVGRNLLSSLLRPGRIPDPQVAAVTGTC